jgi:hypothetical protein
MTDSEIIYAFASGTTSLPYVVMFRRGEKYSILKEKARTAYVDRMTGSKAYPAEYMLVKNGTSWRGYPREFETLRDCKGRPTKDEIKAMEAKLAEKENS